MNVILAKSAGFCWGVSRAIEKARSLAGDGPLYTEGPLIHNEAMIERLREEGITEAGPLSDLSGARLLIRAHGIPPERRAKLADSCAEIIDTTCPDVARIQGLIRKHARQGYHIVIYGDKGHAEVTGLLGFAENRGHVVTSPGEIPELPDMDRVCVVSQSTQFPSCYNEIAETVKKRWPEAVILDTICEATKNRQKELLEIAGEADVIVVVGGVHSANTVRLAELASSIKPTFHIQSAEQIDEKDFSGWNTAGLTAGASTPEFIIEEVRKKLEDI